MPQNKSAKKRVRSGLKRQARNRAARSTLKTSLKQLAQLKEKNRDEAVRKHAAVLDRAVKRGLIHANKAARLKSTFDRGA